MDAVFIVMIVLSNSIASDFLKNQNFDMLFDLIENEEIVGYGEGQALNLNNSQISVNGLKVNGKLLVTSSENKDKHMIFFSSRDDYLWERIEKKVIDNSDYIRRMSGAFNPVGSNKIYYGIPEFEYRGNVYNISIIRDEGGSTESETQIFLKFVLAEE